MTRHTTLTTAAIVVALALAQPARGDFTLWGDETMTVNSYHAQGILYDQSRASIITGGDVYNLHAYNISTVDMSGGSVNYLHAYDSSTVDMSGGEVYLDIFAYDTSAVDMSEGSVYRIHSYESSSVRTSGGEVYGDIFACNSSTVDMSDGSVWRLHTYDSSSVRMSGGSVYGDIFACNSSTVDMSDGSVYWLHTYDSSTVRMSGGSVGILYARDTSTVLFDGQDFHLGEGLSLDGWQVLGTGVLSGEWFDGTPWTVNIMENAPPATILLIPEPGMLALVALGALGLLLRKRTR